MLLSVVMTVFKMNDFFDNAFESILNQTFGAFELIVVIEKGAEEEVVDKIESLACLDKRIRIIRNFTRLGLADSLNVGIDAAEGKYIARMDDDDFSEPARFEKQIEFLEKNSDVSVCGTLQKTITPFGEHILECAVEAEELKAEMLFGCQISHTSVMFRRTLVEDGLFRYDKSRLSEDFALWLDLINIVKMVNLNESLVSHRVGFGSVSQVKGEKLFSEQGTLIREKIKEIFGVEADEALLCYPWRYTVDADYDKDRLNSLISRNYVFLNEIYHSNKKRNFVGDEILKKVLFKRSLEFFGTIGLRQLSIYMMQELKKNSLQYELFDDLYEAISKFIPANIAITDRSVKIQKKINSGSRIVIYGNGKAYDDFVKTDAYKKLKSDYVYLGVADSSDVGVDIRKEEIRKINPDYVLVSTGKYFEEIRKDLVKNCGVENERVALIDVMRF